MHNRSSSFCSPLLLLFHCTYSPIFPLLEVFSDCFLDPAEAVTVPLRYVSLQLPSLAIVDV